MESVHKPVFTQAMCDAGELPSVGMEVFVRGGKRTILLCADSEGDYVTMSEHGSYDFDSINQFKPLTPPIELIDGKAYQFDCGRNTMLGFFNGKGFIGWSHSYWNLPDCTNIKPLTVEG